MAVTIVIAITLIFTITLGIAISLVPAIVSKPLVRALLVANFVEDGRDEVENAA